MDELFTHAQPDSPTNPVETPVEPNPRLQFEFSPQGVGKLIGALAKARKAFKPVIKSSKNPFFKSKYADLAEVLAATVDALSDNGIAIIQPPTTSDKGPVQVVTFMGHESGEWIKSILEMPVSKYDAQGIGSAITYGRRYAYSGTVSVGSEEDDDGNAAVSDREFEKDFDQRTQDQRLIGDYQRRAWTAALKQSVRTDSQISAYFKNLGIETIQDMPKAVFNDAIKWLLNPKIKDDLTEDLKDSVQAVAKKGLNFPKLFAEAKAKGVPEEDVKRWAYETFKIKSMTELTAGQFAEVAAWIGTLA